MGLRARALAISAAAAVITVTCTGFGLVSPWFASASLVFGATVVRAYFVGVLAPLHQAAADPLVWLRRHDEFGAVSRAVECTLTEVGRGAEQRTLEQSAKQDDLQNESEARRRSAEEVRGRAQEMLDATVQRVITELDEVIAGVEAVRDATGAIDERVSAAGAITRHVVGKAREADQVVSALGASLHRVDNMTSVIAGVAGQTNLLALNATIEAARAGVAGRGFAVVATEVKGLAQTTAASTVDISATVTQLQSDATAVGATLHSMSDGVAEIDTATAALAAVAQDQRARVDNLAMQIAETKTRLAEIATLNEKLERRGAERRHVSLPATFTAAGRDHEVVVSTLSDTGASCLFTTDPSLDNGTAVTLKLALGNDEVRITGTVVRLLDRAPLRVALRFTPTDDKALALVKRYLNSSQSVNA